MSGTSLSAQFFCVLFLLLAMEAPAKNSLSSPRERIPFDGQWRFFSGDPAGVGDELSYTNLEPWIEATGARFTTNPQVAAPAGNPGANVSYTQPGFDDRHWKEISLPNDWAINGPFEQKYAGETAKLKYWGPVWYRKHFNMSAADSKDEIFLDIEGAMSYSEVWLNGRFVGGWPYGYASFELNLTPYIKFDGENVLAIRLDTPPNASRWYPGGGIYRNVWLIKTEPVHIGQWGVSITTPQINPFAAKVNIQTCLVNETGAPVTVSLKNEIFELQTNDSLGKFVGSFTAHDLNLSPDETTSNTAGIVIKNPRLWNITEPSRYVVVTSIERDGKLLDGCQTPFGIRTIQFTADRGFLLNGSHLKIHGVCLHDDLGPLGMAFNLRARQRQLQLLREMGCNAIRTSHNPPAPEFLDLCDRMGFLVMDEAFDGWALAKRPGDYSLLFPDWHEKDLRAYVRRDRNHPCVILWSIGNEVYEQHDTNGWKLGRQLADIVHQEDPTRPVTMALHTVEASTNGFQNVVDVFGFNYKPFDYAQFRKDNPNIPLIGSETVSCVSSRGEYFYPVSMDKKLGRSNFQVTSYDVAAPSWGYPPDEEFEFQDRNPFVAGEFVWTGFDYLGEPTPFDTDTSRRLIFTDPAVQAKWDGVLKAGGKIMVPSRSSYFGIFDLCGFRKDRFYLYQSRWRPDLPMAHIVPQNWNWSDRIGKITPVEVYTSGDSAELFLNHKSLGLQKKDRYQYRLWWTNVVYQPGTLEVVAYKNGEPWATNVVKTTGPAAKLALTADSTTIRADGKDLSFVTLTVEDSHGLMVPNADNPIHFSIKGPGTIIATGNGDPTSHVGFQSQERDAFNGLCLAIIRANETKSGKITLRAESTGLAGATVIIRSRAH